MLTVAHSHHPAQRKRNFEVKSSKSHEKPIMEARAISQARSLILSIFGTPLAQRNPELLFHYRAES